MNTEEIERVSGTIVKNLNSFTNLKRKFNHGKHGKHGIKEMGHNPSVLSVYSVVIM